MPTTKPWILGLDLGPRSHGALVFAAWLRSGGAAVHGVHVLEAWAGPFLAAAEDLGKTVREAVAERYTHLGLPSLEQVDAVVVPRAEDGLLAAAAMAAGLVIGRAAPRGERPRVRLGSVARRVLRTLPVPVVVVPPDLATVAPGPILLATDLGPSSDEARRFAVALAAAQERQLELVHVGEPRHGDLFDEFDPAWSRERQTYRAGVQKAVDAWAAGHSLGDRPCHVRFGNRAEEIADVAAHRSAALVVTGSRRLGLAGRLFSTSTASELAGLADCAVAVVPGA